MRPFISYALAFIAGALIAAPAYGGTIVLRDVHIVDPDRNDIRASQTVVIEGGRISAVGPVGSLDLAENATIVEAEGRYLIPGLWDMHVHINTASPTDLSMMVAHGVTAVRDMGGDPFRMATLRRRIENGELIGPDIRFAGPILEDRGWLMRRRSESRPLEHRVPVDNPAEAYSIVALARQWGADLIKIRNVTDAATFRAIMEAARSHGLTVAGHEPIVVAIDEAALLGMNSFEHIPFMMTLPGKDADAATVERTIGAFLSSGAYLTPTLIASNSLGLSPAELLARIETPDPRYAYLSTAMLESWRTAAADDAGPLPWAAMRERSLEILLAMHQAGVPILAGTDYGVPLTFPGSALHDELELLAGQAGLTPAAALQAATTHPARHFGLSGVIEPGSPASMVLLRSNPLVDIGAIREIDAVLHKGRILDREALERLMAEVERDKDLTNPNERRDGALNAMREACTDRPTPECQTALGGYHFSKGQFATARQWLERPAPNARDTSLLFLTHINLLYTGETHCAELNPVAEKWLAINRGAPDLTLGILSQILGPLAARGCGKEQVSYLRKVAELDVGVLLPSSRPLFVEHTAVYLAKVEGDENAAFALRESIMPQGWREDSAALRSLADWCLEQKIALVRGRELAQLAATTAETDIDRLYAMLSEARLAGAQEDYAAAIVLLEKITSVVTNERIEATLAQYRVLAK